MTLTPVAALQHSLFQLYFTSPRGSRAAADRCASTKVYRKVISCQWSAASRVSFDYSQLITAALPLFPESPALSTLLTSLHDCVFVLIGAVTPSSSPSDAVLCAKRVLLASSALPLETVPSPPSSPP